MKEILRELSSLVGPFPSFDTTRLPTNPTVLFHEWVLEAINAGIKEPHAMTLSTVDDNGFPDARVLILKDVMGTAFLFASSSRSRKGRHIDSNPKASLTFYWKDVGRQIRIRGYVKRLSSEDSAADFLHRSTDARAVALIGKQSEVLENVGQLERSFVEQRKRIEVDPNIVEPNWSLYAVDAVEIEFWQARTDRRHVRVRYVRIDDIWSHTFLFP